MSDLLALKKRLNLRKNVSFAVGEFAINMALLFFSYRLIILQGGLEAVGVWATLYAWTNLIRLGDAGVAGAAARFLALWDITKEPKRIRAHGETALLTNVAQFGLLTLIGYTAISPFVNAIVGEAHAAEALAILPYMMLSFFLLNVCGTVLGILQGLHLGYRRSQLSVLGTSIQLAAVFALVPTHGLLGLALAQILQHAVIAIIGWSMARRLMGSRYLPMHFDWSAFLNMLGFSIKAQVVNIANGLLEPVSKILVGHFGGMAAQGVYELAFKTVLLPRNFIGSAANATIPAATALFQENQQELRRLYTRTFRITATYMGIATLALITVAPAASTLWLGRVDGIYWLYVGILAVGFSFSALGAPAFILGIASGRLRANIIVSITTLSTLAVLGTVLGMLAAGDGVVIALCFSYMLFAILMLTMNSPGRVLSEKPPP